MQINSKTLRLDGTAKVKPHSIRKVYRKRVRMGLLETVRLWANTHMN